MKPKPSAVDVYLWKALSALDAQVKALAKAMKEQQKMIRLLHDANAERERKNKKRDAGISAVGAEVKRINLWMKEMQDEILRMNEGEVRWLN